MKIQKTSLDSMLKSIIEKRPKLIELMNDKSILEYLRPAIEWKQQKEIFSHTTLLSSIICSYIEKLYGQEFAGDASKQLEKSWVVETGAHLHVPRRYDHVGRTQGAQINSLLFQGQVLWALTNQRHGGKVSISLNSGRVPLDNTNSGAYLDLPGLKTPITLASKKKHPDSPQSFIPARTKDEIVQKLELLKMYRKQKMISEEQYVLGEQVLSNFLSIQSSFSDQVATSHALMLNTILPVKQLTLDSEFVGTDFILALLKDTTSLTYSIFNSAKRRRMFLTYLKDIQTGWSDGGSPFYSVVKKDGGYRLATYNGDLSPKTIIQGLEEKTLWPTGVMKFFAMMVEAGMLPVGGWTQTGYCTRIKTQSVSLLHAFGEFERAEALIEMPTHIAAVAPCWGIDNVDGNLQLLDPITAIFDPTSIELSYITNLTARQTFLIATPTLYEFLLGEPPQINYNNFKDISHFAIMRS